MEEFNFENASKFLQKVKETHRNESPRQVIIRLAPQIREMSEAGFTLQEIYNLLVEEFGLSVSFPAFRNYLYRKRKSSGPSQ